MQQSFSFTTRPAPQPPTPSRRNIVIEAGAGTGKTTAIVGEVLRLMLERDDLASERIVLMTFTEKAAGEIADRIREALSVLGSQLSALSDETAQTIDHRQPITWPSGSPNPLVTAVADDRTRAAVAHHLANVDSLRSQTIHSFCQSLLRSFPLEAGLDPQFKIIEGFERSLLYGQIYDAWLDEETRLLPIPERVEQWELLFEHAGYLFQIRDLILGLIERRDLLAETEYDFGAIADVEETLLDAIHAIRQSDEDNGDEHAHRVFAYIREHIPDCSSLEEWLAYLQPIANDIREANLPKKGVTKEALNALRSGSKGHSIYDRLADHRAAMALVALTRRFLDFLDAEKRKLGVVDFDDLLLRTLALLDDPAVLDRARRQFDFIFVDEFQDTDRTQARIISKLARDAYDAFVPGKTIVVGDPKQSIYGFRRADPETYYRTTEELARSGADVRVIGDQYRSDPELLDVINAMFACLFPEQPHDPNVFRPAYKPLRAARTKPRRALDARVTLLQATHEDKAERHFAEAEVIARWILDQRDGSERDLQRFAILFRRLTKLDDYLDTLDRYGIEYVLPPTRLFLDRAAPVDLVAVLRAIAYPFDRGAQISAARSPYFALTDLEIANGDEAWLAFEESIVRFRDSARQRTVAELIDLVIRTCGIESVYAAAADGDRSLRHLEHVRSIAFEYDLRQGGSVRQFVEEIARRRTEPEEMEPSLIDETQNAVRIMSVHAAKGLEFETVILPDLSVQSPQSGVGLFAVDEPVKSLVMTGRATTLTANFREAGGVKLREIARQRDEAEMQRLFYVAVTRAMTDVVFVVNPEEKKAAGFHKCLMTVLQGAELQWPSIIDTPIGRVALAIPAEHEGRGARGAGRLKDRALQTALAQSDIVPVTVPAPPPLDAPLTTPEIAARRAASRSRVAGILLHRVLELWDGRTDVEPLLKQLALESAADTDTVTRVRRRLGTIARSPMLQRIARAETLGREVPIRFLEDGIVVERRIDRLLREPDADLVIDYKSGTPEPSRVTKDRDQVSRYCAAIRAITGRPCRGVIWYVDGEGEVGVEVGALLSY
ncbi:MAG TPA: UvrD-helicase domain-containing protein [Thermoanaerobaculia bacterium]|nr:UvrD-helicase domain-containing protein [Thermoanaerobaculia bacterium]